MSVGLFGLWLSLALVGLCSGKDICSSVDTGFKDPQQLAVVCYSGNFLTKMLTELYSGQHKTVEHVRVHLLPYLGGPATLVALKSDVPSNPNCTVCYTDDDTSNGLIGLRNLLSSAQLAAYDSLQSCYAILTNRILSGLEQSEDGVWLVPSRSVSDPFTRVVILFGNLFLDPSYNWNSCPRN